MPCTPQQEQAHTTFSHSLRSLLLSQLAERNYSQEELGSIVNTPVFRILVFAIDKSGPRFWFHAFALLQITQFALVSWAVTDITNHNPAVSVAILVIHAGIAIQKAAKMKVYRDMEMKSALLEYTPCYRGWKNWYQYFCVYSFLLIGCGLSLPAWPVLMIMSRVGSTRARAQGQ